VTASDGLFITPESGSVTVWPISTSSKSNENAREIMRSIPALEINRLFARSEELIADNQLSSGQEQEDLREVFRRKRALTAELLRENERLRVQNLLLEQQRLEAEQRLESSRLGIENQELRTELELLNQQLAELEKKSQKFCRRYEDIEKYNTALSNVYVALNQLHAMLDFSQVVKTVGEILWNLVAAPVFAIFLRNEKTGTLSLIGGEGVEGRFPGDVLPGPNAMVTQALAEGVSLFVDGQVSGDPLAVIPLRIEGRGVIGLITVYEIEPHKGQLSELDKELFDTLGTQTATALTSSQVYSETVKKMKSMESFIQLIKSA
jgi:chaperonin cofactor prefoldin